MIGSALEIAAAVRSGRLSAVATVDAAVASLTTSGTHLTAVSRVLAERAQQQALSVDDAVAHGRDPGPLAGVPYGVKDLFDVAGLPTTAGSALYADAPPALADATAIQRLTDAGAILLATLNMDEFAYGFATINATYGTTRNPHDLDRLAGGSSGGSAAVVSAGLLPFSLGSDTNGSIRVPASLTGIFGLKPTHGTLPMDGVFPFAKSFDDAGPFASSVADLACVWAVLRGIKLGDECGSAFRVARLGGRFDQNIDAELRDAMAKFAPDSETIDLPDIAKARSAAFLITAYEGGRLHREALARDAMTFDPATRDRLIAGALLPHALYEEAQSFCARYCARINDIIADYDVLLAPATPCVAPLIGDPRILIDGMLKPARAELGIHTQPISFMGLPALSVPLLRPGKLPLGLQLIGKAGDEQTLFRYAATLEKQGLVGVSPPLIIHQGELV
jgi:aspartyl-tRNA(Asn)/glutamyl-tRNA(Gln) amidotransferase subunit A